MFRPEAAGNLTVPLLLLLRARGHPLSLLLCSPSTLLSLNHLTHTAAVVLVLDFILLVCMYLSNGGYEPTCDVVLLGDLINFGKGRIGVVMLLVPAAPSAVPIRPAAALLHCLRAPSVDTNRL